MKKAIEMLPGTFPPAFIARMAIDVGARSVTRRRLAEWREALETHGTFTADATRVSSDAGVAQVDRLRALGLKRLTIKRRVVAFDRQQRRQEARRRDDVKRAAIRATATVRRDYTPNPRRGTAEQAERLTSAGYLWCGGWSGWMRPTRDNKFDGHFLSVEEALAEVERT